MRPGVWGRRGGVYSPGLSQSGSGGVVAPVDPTLSLYLPFEGANGSTTIVDASSYAHTVNRFGDMVISSARAYAGSTSGFFPTTNTDYLTIAKSAALTIGTGNFTIEAWTYCTAKTRNYPTIYCNYLNYGSGIAIFASHNATTGKYSVALNAIAYPSLLSTSDVTLNVWTHVAVVRNGNTATLYINGVSESTANVAGQSMPGDGGWIFIGASGDFPSQGGFCGNMDNVRVYSRAKYTSNFTPTA